MNARVNLALIALAALVIGTGCTRARRLENPTPVDTQAPAAATEIQPEATLAPTATQAATGTPLPALTATPIPPTLTAVPLSDKSDPLADQLDGALSQFDQSIGPIDTLEDPP